MISKNQMKEIIFILPSFNFNRTAGARFISLINALSRLPLFKIKVLTINYTIGNRIADSSDKESAEAFINSDIIQINYHPRLNYIQKIGFYFLDKGNLKIWKITHFFHLLLFQKDIYHPNLSSLNLGDRLSENGYIFSSGDPFSYYDVAAKLATKLNYDLILDYRDPWTFGYQLLGGHPMIHNIKNNLQTKKEMQLLRKAALITTVSETLKKQFPKEFQEKLFVISNGSNYEEKEIHIDTQQETFDVVYLGTIYHEQLEDESFFNAFQSFIQDKDQTKIKLYFLGSHLNPTLKSVLHKYGLNHISTITKRLSKSEVLPYLNKASVFLHLKYGKISGIITSKQADYLAFIKPILLPISDHGDLAKSITENNAGFVGNNVDDILNFLETRWAVFIKNEAIKLPSTVDLKDLSRESQAKKFVGLLTRHFEHSEKSAT